MNIAIIGVGPHFRRTYLQFLDKYDIIPKLIVELDSEKENVARLISERNWDETNIVTIPDYYKDDIKIPICKQSILDNICRAERISHAIIATEPKGHSMYLTFFTERGINTLVDKPLVCYKDMLNISNIEMVKNTFLQLLQQTPTIVCKILCQRNYHKGYEYIRNLLKEFIIEYNIPITYVSVYSCDGNWVMPHDLDYENHPYKYGYGKLFHSGYHFIDLLISLLRLNNYVSEEKKIVKAKMYSSFVTPSDELDIINITDYRNLFHGEEFPIFYQKGHDFSKYGEKDIYTQIEFANLNNKVITIANLNILESGFSRRGWLHTKEDRYKGNGRVRHESVNIQVGPLLNIQVHSYQSKEIKERGNEEFNFGGLDHFDIDIYRNVDIVGGKPYERIRSTDLCDFSDELHFLGLNEKAREDAIKAFLSLEQDKNDLINQRNSMELLYQLSMSYYNYIMNNNGVRKFSINFNDII